MDMDVSRNGHDETTAPTNRHCENSESIAKGKKRVDSMKQRKRNISRNQAAQKKKTKHKSQWCQYKRINEIYESRTKFVKYNLIAWKIKIFLLLKLVFTIHGDIFHISIAIVTVMSIKFHMLRGFPKKMKFKFKCGQKVCAKHSVKWSNLRYKELKTVRDVVIVIISRQLSASGILFSWCFCKCSFISRIAWNVNVYHARASLL